MFKIALVVFREFLEIAILIGIIMAVTEKINKSRFYIIFGSILGVMGSALIAFFARALAVSFNGLGDEILNSCIILAAVCMIAWTIVWMQNYGNKVKKNLGDLSEKITAGIAGCYMLVLTVAITILREGTEIILLIFSIASVEKLNIDNYLIGLGIGAISGILVGTIIYWGLLKFASKYIFNISSILLMLVAAGLASEAAGILTSTGIISVLSDQLWDSSWLLDDMSVGGKIINIVTGYNSRPNGMQVVFYFSTICLIWILTKINKSINSK